MSARGALEFIFPRVWGTGVGGRSFGSPASHPVVQGIITYQLSYGIRQRDGELRWHTVDLGSDRAEAERRAAELCAGALEEHERENAAGPLGFLGEFPNALATLPPPPRGLKVSL